MLIREWMTRNVITVTPDTSMMKASKLMKENGFRRLPVLDGNGKLIGIVSDRDIKELRPPRRPRSTCTSCTICCPRSRSKTS